MRIVHLFGTLLLFTALVEQTGFAAAEEDSIALERFDLHLGSGTSKSIAVKNSLPYRISAGADLRLGQERRVGIGYEMLMSFQNSESSLTSAHSFPVLSYFIIPQQLQVRLSPGIASRGRHGSMMGTPRDKDEEFATAFRVATSAEWRWVLEDSLSVAFEFGVEHVAKVTATNRTFPEETGILVGINFHYLFNQIGHHR